MKAAYILCFFLLLTTCSKTVLSDWTASIHMISYVGTAKSYHDEANNRACCCICSGSTCCGSSRTCNTICPTSFAVCVNGYCQWSGNSIQSDNIQFTDSVGTLPNPFTINIPGQLNAGNMAEISFTVIYNGERSAELLIPGNNTLQWTPTRVSATFTASSSYVSTVFNITAGCARDYYTTNCGVYCVPTNDSTGRYTCNSEGNKVCLSGYKNSSANCTEEIITCNCHSIGGSCTPSKQCQCNPGWEGSDCSTPICSPACINGTCTSPNTCSCNEFWSGSICDVPVCVIPCNSTGGNCTQPNTCTCNDGWTGRLCDIFIEPPLNNTNNAGGMFTASAQILEALNDSCSKLSLLLNNTNNVGGMFTASTQIFAALNDSCSKCGDTAESTGTGGETSTLLTIGGLMSIINTVLIVVVLIVLLVMSICFLMCRSKDEYKIDSKELTKL